MKSVLFSLATFVSVMSTSHFAQAATYSHTTTTYATGGEYCREYTKPVRVGGYTQEGYGTACMKPDGSWEIVSDEPDAPMQPAVQYIETAPSTTYVQPVHYVERPYYAPPYAYYQPYYPSQPFISLSFGGDRHYRKHHGHDWKHHRKHWNYSDDDRDNWRDRRGGGHHHRRDYH